MKQQIENTNETNFSQKKISIQKKLMLIDEKTNLDKKNKLKKNDLDIKNIEYQKEKEFNEIKKQLIEKNEKEKSNNINSKKIRLNSEMNSGINYSKDIKKRSKSNNIMKSRTINTEVRVDKKYKKGKIEGVNNDFIKRYGTRYNSNNIDDMLLYMFIKQKHNGKKMEIQKNIYLVDYFLKENIKME